MSREPEDQTLWIQDLDQDDPRELAGTAGAERPFWSADSRLIGFALKGDLVKIAVESGRCEVYVRQFPQGRGTQQISSTGGGRRR